MSCVQSDSANHYSDWSTPQWSKPVSMHQCSLQMAPITQYIWVISSVHADADSFFDDPLKIQMNWGDDAVWVSVGIRRAGDSPCINVYCKHSFRFSGLKWLWFYDGFFIKICSNLMLLVSASGILKQQSMLPKIILVLSGMLMFPIMSVTFSVPCLVMNEWHKVNTVNMM